MAPLLVLTGFMGSGKTRVGRRVAELLGWSFTDLDDQIVEADGIGIPEFFASRGELAFRAREFELLAAFLEKEEDGRGRVLSLGGGTLENPAAAALVRGRQTLVYLDVDPATAWRRAQGRARPLARDRQRFETLLANRRVTYEDVAGWLIPVGGRSIETLAQEIAEIARSNAMRPGSAWGRRLASTARASLILGGSEALLTLRQPPLVARGPGSRLFVITDENVKRAWGDRVLALLREGGLVGDMLTLAAGEKSKSAATLERCWDWLAGCGARRDDTVVALGGGVVGDVAGLAAATYQRGISLWQIPTSLLAQVDSSVGGKTGINLEAGKNLVGAFYQPDLVVADPITLGSLPEEEYTNGLGEVVKYGLLHSGTLFATLEENHGAVEERDPELVGDLVKKCVTYKAAVVEQDERDQGRRAVLNLGHTMAHALEVTQGYGALSHGRAVGLGLLVALAVSERVLSLDRSVRDRTLGLLRSFGLPVVTELPDSPSVLKAAGRDKKVVSGTRGFVGLRAIGDPVWGLDVPDSVLLDALEVIRG